MRTNRGKTITIGNALVFLMFVVFGALSFSFFSPIIITNADSNVGAEINTSVNSVISATLDAEKVSTTIIPTEEGSFSSQAFVVNISTNSIRGYEIYFSSVDDETDMTSEDSDMTISSDFDTEVTGGTMHANTWGYSVDNETFRSIPTLSSQRIVRNIGHFPSDEEKKSSVYIGAKIGSDLRSGVYSKYVQFTAIAHAYDYAIEPTMQGTICSSMDINDTALLKDTRDGEMYNIAKLKDGRCWMTENLRIVGPLTLTASDSDVIDDFELPESTAHWGTRTDSLTTPYLADSGNDLYGVYYNYAATSAGTMMGIDVTVDGLYAYDTEHSICPKGWKLPLSSEYDALFTAYGISFHGTDMEKGWKVYEPLMSISKNGYYRHNDEKAENQPDEWEPYAKGTYGYLWTASHSNATMIGAVSFKQYGPDIDREHRHHGYGVRCVALDR